MVTQLTTIAFLQQDDHLEDGRNNIWNMSVRILGIKYTINIKTHFVDYLYFFKFDYETFSI